MDLHATYKTGEELGPGDHIVNVGTILHEPEEDGVFRTFWIETTRWNLAKGISVPLYDTRTFHVADDVMVLTD